MTGEGVLSRLVHACRASQMACVGQRRLPPLCGRLLSVGRSTMR